LALAIAILFIPVIAQDYGLAGSDSVDILGTGIFETDGSLIGFPEAQDTNVDTLVVGNDKALAFGNIWQKAPVAIATNNLEIKKNQDSGKCSTIRVSPQYKGKTICQNSGIKVNLEQINLVNREATTF
jgi:hypothetical protein